MSVATFVVRMWIPDRPGALGQVASRIGAVRGDVVGIEILERGGGRAIDEIVVELPDPALVDTLIREINQVEGVDVEEIRPVDGGHIDPWLGALETASQLVGAATAEELLGALVEHAHRGIGTAWVAVVDLDAGAVSVSQGPVPTDAWLTAFIEGSRQSARIGSHVDARDVTWVPLPASRMALVLGRDGTAFRAKERHQVAALARIADAWMCGLQTIERLTAPGGPSPVSGPPLDAIS